MRKNHMAKIVIFSLLLCAATFCAFAAESDKEKELPVIAAFEVQRTGDFLKEPGNNDHEILRRIGRAINKELSPDKERVVGAALFDSSKLSTKNFVIPVADNKLSETQKKESESIMSKFDAEFKDLAVGISSEKGAIIAKAALESEKTKLAVSDILNDPNLGKILSEEEKKQFSQSVLPVLESSDYVIALLSISNNGVFVKGKMVSETNKLDEKDTAPITISDYVNENALIYFVQNGGKCNPEETYEDLKLIPQTAMIEQALKAAELDFKKDLLSNMAEEYILSINLEPSGDGSLPDMRITAPVPNITALREILPKLKQLCIQMGVYTEIKQDEKYPVVKLSFFMLKNYAVYMGLVEDFFVMATGYDNIKNEIEHVAKIKSLKPSELKNKLGKYKRYGKIRTKDFNVQLQRLLASPLLQNQGVPPIPNLNILNDLEDVTFSLEFKPTSSYLNIEMPIAKKLVDK